MLIVSDDHESEGALVRLLGAEGCDARTSAPGAMIDPRDRFDAALIDLSRPSGWGSGTITALRSAEFACASLILLTQAEPRDVAASLSGGAVDCLLKPIVTEDLLEGVANAVRCTRRWRGRLSAARVRPAAPQPDLPAKLLGEPAVVPRPSEVMGPRIELVVHELTVHAQLTPREAEVLFWLLHGHRYDDIASVLGVATRTAKFHAANLLRKLELESRHDLPRLLTGR